MNVDLRDYYDDHWTHVAEGEVDYSRLRMVLEAVEPGQKVLDSGCGPGFLAALLAERGADVVGTDVSAVGPERTRARGIPAQQVDLDTDPLPFADGEFDAVVANSNLEHLFYMHRHVRECARCVRAGGKFIWLVPNIGHWRYRLWLLAGRFPYIPNSPTDEYHIRYVTAYEARKLLVEAGLRQDPDAGPRGHLVPRALPAPARQQVHETVLRPGVRARSCACARRSSPVTSVSRR